MTLPKRKPATTEEQLADTLELHKQMAELVSITADLSELRDVLKSNVRNYLEKYGLKSYSYQDVKVRLLKNDRPIFCRCCNYNVAACPNVDKAIANGTTVEVYRSERDVADFLHVKRVSQESETAA